MKSVKLISITAGAVLLALLTFSASALPAFSESPIGKTIFTLHVSTPTGKDIQLNSFIVKTGQTKAGMCNVTKIINMDDKYSGVTWFMAPGSHPTDSATLISEFGTGYDCMNIILGYKNSKHQTGFIFLTKNGADFTAAIPNQITMHF